MANRRYHFILKCRLCENTLKNLCSHLLVCQEHLGRVWWGIVGGLTCSSCQQYHKPSDITRCGGSYIPLFHKDLLISRHTYFMAYLMEEFGVKTPRGVHYNIKDLGLNSKCVSDLTDREVTFLEILDTHYGTSQQENQVLCNISF